MPAQPERSIGRVSDRLRKRLGIAGLVAGSLLVAGGIAIAHVTGLPVRDSVGREIFPHIPRCLWFETDPAACWVLPAVGQSIAFVGSQIALAGIVIGWIFDRPLTWALATLAAFLVTLEMIIIFGIVPNEMLAVAQGPLEWTDQKIAFTIPPWLVLNNDVSISYGVITDMIVAGYTTTMLIVIIVGAYQLQEWNKRRGQPKPPTTSLYGRPVVRGNR
jgi:hypothetical protein